MNKDTRKALISNLTNDFLNVRTADDAVNIATAMVDAAKQGRTDRWKNASLYAGCAILARYDSKGRVYRHEANDLVDTGLTLMVEANK